VRLRRGLLLLPALALAGCGGGTGGGSSGSSGSAGGKTITISETEFKLNPSTVNLATAGTYVFKATNDGQYTHALAIQGNGVDAHTADIAGGGSATVKVTLKNGSYEIFCPISGHKQQGMDGSLTVGGAGTGSGSGGGTATTNQTNGGGGYGG
jgi:plastocyanin